MGNRPGWLVDRLTARDQSILLDRDHSLLLPQPEFEGVVKTEQRPLLYMDPILKNHSGTYHDFVPDGLARGRFRAGRRRREVP